MNIREIIDSYKNYHSLDKNNELSNPLANQQHPRVMVISCCDSRVNVNSLLNTSIGEIFQLKVIANIIPHYDQKQLNIDVGAAIEYATGPLQIKDIVILGHSNCGGIKAICTTQNDFEFINNWLSASREELISQNKINPNIDNQSSTIDKVAKNNVLLSANRLKQYPQITQTQNIKIHSWFLDIGQYKIYQYHDERQKWDFV